MASIPQNHLAAIKIVGVGGGGMNAVNWTIEAGLHGVEFIVVNTDVQALLMSDADVRLSVDRELICGLGAGIDPSKGCQAARDRSKDVEEALKGTDMVFVTAGEGGGTGMGVAPIVVKIARSPGVLTISVMTRPLSFEGRRRATQADSDIEALREEMDTPIVIPSDKLLQMADHQVAVLDAFRQANQMLIQGVSGTTDPVTTPSLINLDFADVESTMSQAGSVLMGIRSTRGKDRAHVAAEMAVPSPLLGVGIDDTCGVLLSTAGGLNFGLFEVPVATQLIEEATHDEANITFDTVTGGVLGDETRIIVIAAGLDGRHPPRPPRLETTHSNQQQPPQPRGGFGDVPNGGPSLLAGGTPLTGGSGSYLAPPYVTPMPPTHPEPRPLRTDDGNNLDVPDSTK